MHLTITSSPCTYITHWYKKRTRSLIGWSRRLNSSLRIRTLVSGAPEHECRRCAVCKLFHLLWLPLWFFRGHHGRHELAYRVLTPLLACRSGSVVPQEDAWLPGPGSRKSVFFWRFHLEHHFPWLLLAVSTTPSHPLLSFAPPIISPHHSSLGHRFP